MLLVKKFNFSLYLFSVKIILQIMFNNVLDRNIFPKGLTDAFGQKCIYFSYLFSVKIRLEIMFNKVPDKKETFFGHTKCNLSKSQKLHFFKGINPCFWSKNVIFFFVFGQNMTRDNV